MSESFISKAVPFAHRSPYANMADAVIGEVCATHKVAKTEMIGGRVRTRRVVTARHELVWRLRHQLGMPYPAIGRKLQMNHASAIYGARKYSARLSGGSA